MANEHSEPAIRVSNWTLATNTVPWQRAIATADAQTTPARSGRSCDPALGETGLRSLLAASVHVGA